MAKAKKSSEQREKKAKSAVKKIPSVSKEKKPATPKSSKPRVAAAKKKAEPRLNKKSFFLKLFGEWLESRKYVSSVPTKAIDVDKDIKQVAKLANILQKTLGLAMPIATGGFSYAAEDIYNAIVPLIPLGDFVAWRVDGGLNAVVLVIFADDLGTDVVAQRFKRLFELIEPVAAFGPQVYGSPTCSGNVIPVLVYFNQKKYQESVSILLPLGSQASTFQRINLQAGFVNVPDQTIVWSNRSGLGGWISGLIGNKSKSLIQFETNDLQAVLALALKGPGSYDK